jgi:hypothetical protein
MTDQKPSKKFKKIWFITADLEAQRASSFRQERWCKIFIDCGANVRIFNLRGAFGYCDQEITSLGELTEFRKEAIKQFSGEKNSIREGFFVKFIRKLKHFLLIDLYLPNVVMLFLKINREIKMEHGMVTIMASSPPFSTAIIGALIKTLNPSKVILAIDMRDAWALHQSLSGFRALKKNIEFIVLKKANYLSTVSLGLSKEFKKNYELIVEVIYNVATQNFEKKNLTEIKWDEISPLINSKRKLIVYTGSLPQGFYDTDLILKSIIKIKEGSTGLANKYQFIFIGACNELKKKALKNQIDTELLLFLPNIEHDLIYTIQKNSWALLFFGYLGDDNGGVVSTKLFEYIYSKKPIIPLNICKGSDIDLILNKYLNKNIYLNTSDQIINFLIKLEDSQEVKLSSNANNEIFSDLVASYYIYAKNVISKI